MAEIEHFVHPDRKSTPKFGSVADISVNLLSATAQEGAGEVIITTLGEAVKEKLIANETLGYFLGRTHQFLVLVGVDSEKLRFRQHKKNEMAHYANDCWDAEIFTSYGWIECVGHADRGCYDLTRHSDATGERLQYYEAHKGGPVVQKKLRPKFDKKLMGKTFKTNQQAVMNYVETLSYEHALKLEKDLESNNSGVVICDGMSYALTSDMISFEHFEEKKFGDNIIPHVIEPSFGIGRIIYCLLEHAYTVRENHKQEDEKRAFLALPPIIAPTKAPELLQFTQVLVSNLKAEGLSCKVDDTGHRIGKRYARTDEIGIPFGITIDFETVVDGTITLRERNTTKQVRIKVAEVAIVLQKLCSAVILWSDVTTQYPLFLSKE